MGLIYDNVNIKINKIYNYRMQPLSRPGVPNPPLDRPITNLNVPGVPSNNIANRLPTQTYVQTVIPGQSVQYIGSGSAIHGANINVTRPQVISQTGVAQRPINMATQQVISQPVIGQQVMAQPTLQVPSSPKPKSQSRVQYVPYEKKVVDYETRQVVNTMWVPVQRKCLNYYAIEHITQYLPREVDDVRYETVPQQYVEYRLEYVPVQKEIVHLPGDAINAPAGYAINTVGLAHGNLQTTQGFVQGINTQPFGLGVAQTTNVISGGYHPGFGVVNPAAIPGFTQLQGRGAIPKSNFVTSDGYVPSYLSSNPLISDASYLPSNNYKPSTLPYNANLNSNTNANSGFRDSKNLNDSPQMRRNSYDQQLASYLKGNNVGNQRNSSKYDLLGY